MNFWSFSLQVYGKPGVAEACIALQDGLGLDVNLLLYCCWHGRAHRKLDEAGLRRAMAAVEGWQREVVQPLRAVRRRLKPGVPPITARECLALRRKVTDLEIESERVAQTWLEALPPPPSGGGTPSMSHPRRGSAGWRSRPWRSPPCCARSRGRRSSRGCGSCRWKPRRPDRRWGSRHRPAPSPRPASCRSHRKSSSPPRGRG